MNTIHKETNYFEIMKAALFGVAVGDALGVPFEFSTREKMALHPATDMIGFKMHNQPPGTWSDDSSLTFCLADALANHGYSLKDIAYNFYLWQEEGFWTARGEVFDIGMTTLRSIHRLHKILYSEDTDDLKQLRLHASEMDNGNGSLMRIIPLLFFILSKPLEKQFEMVWEVSALTHRHIRAAMSCMIYLKMGEYILEGKTKEEAYKMMRNSIQELWEIIDFPREEKAHFSKIIQSDIREVEEKQLKSGGYVIEVLESSFYYLLKKSNYKETVLSIINLGHDTDTSATIVGGLAGLYYGFSAIPKNWVNQIARKEDIENLAKQLAKKTASIIKHQK